MPIVCGCHLHRDSATPCIAGSDGDVRETLLKFALEVNAKDVVAAASYHAQTNGVYLFGTKTESGRVVACAATQKVDVAAAEHFLSTCLTTSANDVNESVLERAITKSALYGSMAKLDQAFDTVFDSVVGPLPADCGPEELAKRQRQRSVWRIGFIVAVLLLVCVLLLDGAGGDTAVGSTASPQPPSASPPPSTAPPRPPSASPPPSTAPPSLAPVSVMHYFLALQQCSQGSPWTIHGLWPQNSFAPNDYPQSCTAEPFDLEALADIQSDLATQWPSCPRFRTSNVDFWSHEWRKHGTCSPWDVEDYFTTALLYFYSPVVASYVRSNCGSTTYGQDCKVPIVCGASSCNLCPSLNC